MQGRQYEGRGRGPDCRYCRVFSSIRYYSFTVPCASSDWEWDCPPAVLYPVSDPSK